jgi:hypothetical protein
LVGLFASSSIYSSTCSIQLNMPSRLGAVTPEAGDHQLLAAADHQAAEIHPLHGGPSDRAALVGFDLFRFGLGLSVPRPVLDQHAWLQPFACLPDPAHRSVTTLQCRIAPSMTK